MLCQHHICSICECLSFNITDCLHNFMIIVQSAVSFSILHVVWIFGIEQAHRLHVCVWSSPQCMRMCVHIWYDYQIDLHSFVAFTPFANLTCAGFLPVNVLKRVNIFKRNMSPLIHLTQAKYSCNHSGMSFAVWPVFVGDFSLRLQKKCRISSTPPLQFCGCEGQTSIFGLSKLGNTSVNLWRHQGASGPMRDGTLP